MDAAGLDARLITNDFDFPIFPSLFRCAERLGHVARQSAVPSSSSSISNENGNDNVPTVCADDRPSAYEAFAREVLQYQREAVKAHRAASTLNTEATNYRAAADDVRVQYACRPFSLSLFPFTFNSRNAYFLFFQVTAEIIRVREEVLGLGVALRQQEEVRKHREKLEALAQAVNARPARSDLKRKAAAMEEERANVEGSIQVRWESRVHRSEMLVLTTFLLVVTTCDAWQAADAQLLVRLEQYAALERAVAALQDVVGAGASGGGGSGSGASGEGDGEGTLAAVGDGEGNSN